ncbi:MAG: fibronectin type III domain-containing protein, partial [Clostridia bacterium]|nr:fibronectin type III domain-containing protein [Clostridia bacterium]
TGTKTLSFKIKPIDISTCKVKLSATSYTYNGKVKTPIVTVTNASGTKLTKDKSYTVTYASGRKNAGTYKVTVKMIGNYTGIKTLSFKIKPIDISTCKVKLSSTSYTYNGKVKTPTVTVTNAYGTKLTKDTHYAVSYSSGRKNGGTYKVTVTMFGNYMGTKTLTFKINPPATTIASLKAGTKSITVNLTKKTTQVTGYQIQYSRNKDFTNAKIKTLTSSSTVKTTLTGLTAGKTYYVRVRTYKTVNDVKYYSGWSQYKYVKTK